jgi:hypothetical protein
MDFGKTLRKRHRLIAFIGATIVLATFIVKDEKKDRIKDELATIESAESTFLVRQDNSTTSDDIDSFHSDFLRQAYKEKWPWLVVEDRSPGWGSIILHQIGWAMPRMQLDLDNVKRLYSGLPGTPDEVGRRMKSLDASWCKLNNKVEELMSQEAVAQDQELRRGKKVRDVYPGMVTPAQAKELSRINGDFGRALQSEMEKVPAYMNSLKKQKEDDLHWWTVGSNILFGLGWCVGLTGKLYGVEPGVDG